jgi:hypothetical protein
MSSSDSEGAEGIIHFRYRLDPPAAAPPLAVFRQAHARGLAAGWLGRDPARYDGLAYGNLSLRSGAGFWITASQRIDRPVLDAEDLVEITAVATDWMVAARGTHPPSSETLTHAAVHRAAAPGPLAVFHGHAPELWRDQARLGWATTPPDAANGTFALAAAVAARVRATPRAGALAMLGHRDGILLWAADFDAVFARLDAAAAHLPSDPRTPP